MAREYIEFECVKDDKYLAKKDAAHLLYLARKALEDVREYDNSRMVENAINYCELASACLDNSEFGCILECEW